MKMNPAYIAVGFELLDRLIAWKRMKETADAEGREVSDADVDVFVAEYFTERAKVVESVARARAEGR